MDVLVAAYQDLDTAQRDFDAVAELVRAKQVQVAGILLVEHGGDGQVRVVIPPATRRDARACVAVQASVWPSGTVPQVDPSTTRKGALRQANRRRR